MTVDEFSKLCESIGLERDGNLPWPDWSNDPCLYDIPEEFGDVFRKGSNCVTSHSNSYGYRICLIDDGEKNLGGWMNTDEEIYERAGILSKQLKELREKINLEKVKTDFV